MTTNKVLLPSSGSLSLASTTKGKMGVITTMDRKVKNRLTHPDLWWLWPGHSTTNHHRLGGLHTGKLSSYILTWKYSQSFDRYSFSWGLSPLLADTFSLFACMCLAPCLLLWHQSYWIRVPTLMTSFNLNDLYNGLISKFSHTGCWGFDILILEE